MRTTIAVMGGTATVEDGKWTASRPLILKIVSGIQPAGEYVSDIDLALATAAVSMLDGEITEYTGPATVDKNADY